METSKETQLHTETYLQPSQTSTAQIFCEKKLAKKLYHTCSTRF